MRSSGAQRLATNLAIARLRHNFEEVLVSGLPSESDARNATLVIANHSCMWDASIGMCVTAASRQNFLSFAHTKVLNRHPYLKYAGQIPITRNDPIAAAKTLSSVGRQLSALENTALWVFPQGQHSRLARDATVESGVLGLRKFAPKASFIAAAIHYEFYRAKRPLVWVKLIRVTPPYPNNSIELQSVLQDANQALLQDLQGSDALYRPILKRRTDIVAMSGVPLSIRQLNNALRGSRSTKRVRFELDHTTSRLRVQSANAILQDQLVLETISGDLGPLAANLTRELFSKESASNDEVSRGDQK